MSPPVSRLIELFAEELNEKLDLLFTKYLKAKKSYNYYTVINKNLFKKIQTKEQINILKRKIKVCFKKNLKQFNLVLNTHQKIVKRVKKHKLFMIKRKQLWKKRQLWCKKDEE